MARSLIRSLGKKDWGGKARVRRSDVKTTPKNLSCITNTWWTDEKKGGAQRSRIVEGKTNCTGSWCRIILFKKRSGLSGLWGREGNKRERAGQVVVVKRAEFRNVAQRGKFGGAEGSKFMTEVMPAEKKRQS